MVEWLNDSVLHTKTVDDLLATLNFFFQAMSGAWIEAARQLVRVLRNHGAVLWKVDYQGWSTLRSNEYGSAADKARAAE
jgi:hypothetical protein